LHPNEARAVSSLKPENGFIFRIAHISNVPWMMDHGLHCRNSAERDPNYVEIGNPELILKRTHRDVPIPPGGTLSDYIPFYFTPHSPMLYNIKTGYQGISKRTMSEIVIMISSLPALAAKKIPFVFTDRHAYLQTAAFHSDLSQLNCIAWKLLQNRDFKRDLNDPGKFERYQAEALVHRLLPVTALSGIICHGDTQKAVLQAEVEKRRLTLQVTAKPNAYF
jgi:ssDNA thymidine ADP-ribosyltransferase DarT-like protein